MMGEVKALRALAYFYLVRTFKEVPYGTDPSISDNQEYNREKSSEEFLIGKIIEDLESAERLVRNKFETTRYNKGRIIKSSVRAMLADVYLWTNNYDKCVNYCDLVMADTTYTLTKNDVSSSVDNRIYGSGN